MQKNRFQTLAMLLLATLMCRAQALLPSGKLTRIEVAFEPSGNEAVHRMHELVVELHDATTGDDTVVKSQRTGNGTFMLQMPLRHTVYDTMREGGLGYPFCVAPGDFLVVEVRRDGTLSYRMADGSKSPYERLMRHDISRRTWYSSAEFEADRAAGSFRMFIDRMVQRMDSAVAEVNATALANRFTRAETDIAINNTKMQFAVWMMEYPSWKSIQIALYSRRGKAGWQTLPEHEAQMRELEDPRSYTFLRRLPLNDSTCMASPHFATFLQSYSHTHALTHDQFMYAGDTRADHARMDSAMVAREMAMTRLPHPSVFMLTALMRRNIERHAAAERHTARQSIDTTATIVLPNIEVLSNTLRQRGMTLSEEEQLLVALNNAPRGFNPLAPVFYLINKYIVEPWQKKHPGKKARAIMRRNEILRKYAESDEEFASLVRACEEVQREKARKACDEL